ncbi:histidinol dehydrogenase, partial [Mesonia mobilis]|uniref:histidinol dehydrogenase n=1 Tax=Mesonia mobilis TaxID=369791 RepID=UPI0024BB4C7C
MKIIKNPSSKNWQEVLKRPTQTVDDIEATVNEIFTEVRSKGDQAIEKYTSLFDGIAIKNIEVSPEEIQQAEKQISAELKEAIQLAKENITKFHAAQKTDRVEVETQNGVKCWQEKRPIQKVG